MVHDPARHRRRRTIPAFALALTAIGATATPAAARAPALGAASTEEREAQRTELYREAMKAAGAGRWAEAKERLHAVLAIRSSPKVLFSLAQAEEQLGQLASAQADYARSLEGAALEGKGDVVQAAEQAQRALAPRVPHVRVVVPGAGASRAAGSAGSASATLDEQPVAVGTAAAVDPGEHRLVVSAPGMRVATLSVKVSETQQLDVPVSLEPERSPPAPITPSLAPAPLPPPAPAASVEAKPSAGSSWRTASLVTAGAGVLALGVGAVFGVESKWKHDDAEKACPGATCPAANGASLWHDAVSAGNASTIAFIIGGAGVVAGAVLWLAAPREADVGVQVGFGPGSVQLRGAW
jgi:hypothetical protein